MWYRYAKEKKHRSHRKHRPHHRKVKLFDDPANEEAAPQVSTLPNPVIEAPVPAPAPAPNPILPTPQPVAPPLQPTTVVPPQQPPAPQQPIAPVPGPAPSPTPEIPGGIDDAELDDILNGVQEPVEQEPADKGQEGAGVPASGTDEDSPIKGIGKYTPPTNPLMVEPPVHDRCHCRIETLPGGRQVWRANAGACQDCMQARDAFNQMQDMLFQEQH